MSNKKADSKLPHELNENYGSNYMMDGFDFDMEYGHGLRENPGSHTVPQPPTTGMSQLPEDVLATLAFADIEVPEGVLQEIEGAMDLEELEIITAADLGVDRSDVGIVDYSWLADAYQDPNRLPDKPVDNGLPELQEAWGDRSDGLHRIDLRDRSEITYEDAQQGPEDDDPLNTDKLASMVRMAMRKSAAGVSMGRIKELLIGQLGPVVAKKAARSVHAIELEHGLTGNVYVRASAYPGLHRGKWSKHLKKAAKHARYLVADPTQDCHAAAGVLGLRVVSHPTQIDWNDAYDTYAPGLAMTGRLDRMATVVDKREALRRAFLREEHAPRMDIETAKVRHTMPSDRVTASDAKQTLIKFRPRQQQVITLQRRWKKAEVEKMVGKIGHLVEAHLLSQEQANRLLASKAAPNQILRTAALLAINVRKGSYSGGEPVLAQVKITSQQAWSELRTAERKADERETALLQRIQYDKIEQKVAFLNRHIQGGLKGSKLATLIRETLSKEEAVMAAPLLSPILKKTSALNSKVPGTKKYAGKEYHRHVQANVELEIPPREINKAARWVRQAMSEGFAGKDLDDLVRVRLDPRVHSAGSKKLVQIRKTHEGLAGHLYVDAGAYASKTGAEGCEHGGLKHRTNGLKYVLAMKRCGACVFKNADGVCQKYNKVVVDEIPTQNLEILRHKMLASHEASDQELTGALFSLTDIRAALAPKDEFGLHNGALDDVETDNPEVNILDGIFFGGFEV